MRMEAKREHFIPKGARKVAHKGSSAVAYVYEGPTGILYALGFHGKAQRPDWHFRFKTEQRREQRVREHFEGVAANEGRKAQRKAEEKAKRAKGHGWEPGLILMCSWGYEQTNVDFYEVTALVGSTMVEVEQIGTQQATDSTDGQHAMSDKAVPNPDHRMGRKGRYRVTDGSIRLSGYAYAHPWDGKAVYRSWYA